MIPLMVATRNKGKWEEIQAQMTGLDVECLALSDRSEIPDVIEDAPTFEGNALKKAREIARATGTWVLADDSGLVVEALNGEPGVRSARYAGDAHDSNANNRKLIEAMTDVPEGKRQAAFVCVMALVAPDGREWVRTGRCEGEILFAPQGTGGFGYDPLFFIPGKGRTMAELAMEEKNGLSHRGQALGQIIKVLRAEV